MQCLLRPGILSGLLLASPDGLGRRSLRGRSPRPPTSVAPAYPRIHPDLRVTFRVKAPDAQKVEFNLGKRYLAEKGEEGFWTATTEPQVPGFHYYWLVIDGVMVNDPASETFYGTGKETSGIEVPEKGVDFYSPRDVPHGEVRERWYHSKTTGGLAADLRLHAARLRHEPRRPLSRALPPARRRRGRTGLVESGTGRLHPGQPDRRGKSEADARS